MSEERIEYQYDSENETDPVVIEDENDDFSESIENQVEPKNDIEENVDNFDSEEGIETDLADEIEIIKEEIETLRNQVSSFQEEVLKRVEVLEDEQKSKNDPQNPSISIDKNFWYEELSKMISILSGSPSGHQIKELIDIVNTLLRILNSSESKDGSI